MPFLVNAKGPISLRYPLGSIKWQDVSRKPTGASVNKFMMVHPICRLPVCHCSSTHQLSRQAGVQRNACIQFKMYDKFSNAGFLHALVMLTVRANLSIIVYNCALVGEPILQGLMTALLQWDHLLVRPSFYT